MEHSHENHSHHHYHGHGSVDPSLLRQEEGIRAVKYCFCILTATAIFQGIIVSTSGSIALFADTIHNIADACTSIPLWIAFILARRKPSSRFTYGYGRFEDLAGLVIVLIITLSAVLIGYQSITRLLSPTPVVNIPSVIIAALVGYAGNEFVARYRIRVGKKIDSVALIADGYHAKIDSYTSLAVVLSATDAWLGWHGIDPLIGLGIVVILCKIIYESSSAVLIRLLDGIDPKVVQKIARTAQEIDEVLLVSQTRARWSGHRLNAELTITLHARISLTDAHVVIDAVDHHLRKSIPSLALITIHIDPTETNSHHTCMFRQV